jgi:hypothetical protein
MPATRISVSADDLRTRIRHRLLNGALPTTAAVIWTDDDAELVVHAASFDLRLTDGWLLVSVPVETQQTGKVNVRCVFFLGREGRASGLNASGTIDPQAPPILIGRWGDALLSAVWSGVQDLLEGAYQTATTTFPKNHPALVGYTADEGAIRIMMTL